MSSFVPGLSKFTVVIPTRERWDTLQSTLKTCIIQNYNNLEIVVSDNDSQDRTREVVESLQDPRIRYYNTGKRLSMSHNWEFALSHVDDSYVMYLGDDDGILPGALVELDLLIQETGAKAVNWMSGTYGWPTCGYPWIRNKLKFPIGQAWEWRDSKKTLAKVLSCRWGYSELPMLYGFFVHKNIITSATQPGQPFFRSMTPDIYSGVAFSGVLDRFIHSYKPYGIFGISKYSTGASFFNVSQAKSSFGQYISEKNIPFHHKLAFTSSVAILTAECYFQAQDAGVDFDPIQLDINKVVMEAFREASKLQSPARENTIKSLVETCEKNGIQNGIKKKIERGELGIFDKIKPQVSLENLWYKLVFDGEKKGINNIFDACVFAKDVLDKRKKGRLFLKERMEFLTHHLHKTFDSLLSRNVNKWGY